MEFHLFVACAVYALAFLLGVSWLIETLAYLSDPRVKAMNKRAIRKFIRNILIKLVKD